MTNIAQALLRGSSEGDLMRVCGVVWYGEGVVKCGLVWCGVVW